MVNEKLVLPNKENFATWEAYLRAFYMVAEKFYRLKDLEKKNAEHTS